MKTKRSPLKRRQPMRRAKPGPSPLIRALIAQADIMEKHGALKRKPRKPLPKVSARGKARNAEYAKARAAFIVQHDGVCDARYNLDGRLPWVADPRRHPFRCKLPATDLHHRAGRTGTLLWDKTYFSGLCVQCHAWAHSNANEARRLGYLVTPKQP